MNTRKKRKLHGSVLLTVVFVMSILIVFLFGTMALALAANNRAHVNYSSAQTGITARSVAESAVSALDKNVAGAKEYKAAVGALKSTDTPLQVKVGLSNPGGSDSLASMGNIDDVTISYAGTKKFYDETKKEWLERDLLKFTSNVTMSGVTSSASVYVLKHDKDDNEGSGSGGAGFVTTADASLATQTSIWGGAYIGLPKKDDAENYKYVDETGNSNHDVFMNNSNSLIDAYDGTDETAFIGTNSGASIETPLYVCNNMYTENWSHLIFPSKGSGVTVWGDMIFHNNAPSQLNYLYSGAAESSWNFNEIPYVYVDGTISGAVTLGFVDILKGADGNPIKDEHGNTIKSPGNIPMNIFCGNIQVDNPNDFVINGNVYCMDTGITSKLKAKNKTSLYAWTGSVVNRYTDQKVDNEVVGDICTKGNLELEKVTVQGDVRVEGNLTVGVDVTVNGNVVVGGELEGEENLTVAADKKIYYKESTKTVKIPNKTGYYWKCEPSLKPDGNWCGPDPNANLNDGRLFIDGVFQEDSELAVNNNIENPAEVELYYTINAEENEKTNGAQVDQHHIDYAIPVIYGFETDALCFVEGTNNKFYAKTEVVPDSYKNKNNYESTANYAIKVKDAEFDYGITLESADSYLSALNETAIYPAYAEKAVVIGDDKDTKVIMTIEEVLKDVANPYDNKVDLTSNELPNKISELMSSDDFKNSDYLKNLSDITDANGDYVINKSCKLDMNVGNILGKEILIKPGSDHLLILVKNLNIDNGKIIVDDSEGGTVHIVIEESTTGYIDHGTWIEIPWNITGLVLKQTPLLTTSYQKLLNGDYGTKFKYLTDKKKISDTITDTDVKDLTTTLGAKVKPNVNIYGTSSSYLIASNGFKPISANVISPDINVNFASSSGNPFDEFYYNNVDINSIHSDKRAMFFGCLNSHSVISANPLDVIFSTDGTKEGDGDAEDSDPFWYKILYYSEF